MTPEQTRLECLKLAKPDNPLPDISIWMERAKTLESYIYGSGQPSKEAPQQTKMMLSQKPGQPANSGPASRRP